MNVGITTLYAHRTIAYFAAYLNRLLSDEGHSVSALICNSSVPMCHSRLAKNSSRLFECTMCMAGGLLSFPFEKYYAIRRGRSADYLSDRIVDSIVASSVYTIERVETLEDRDSDVIASEKRKLYPGARIVYQNTLDWIDRDSLDLVYCYNGRMDITRAVIEACKARGVRFISFERPWNGFGIQFVSGGNCMSLASRVKLNRRYANKPLTSEQARQAFRLAAMRVSQSSVTEWRTYGEKDGESSKLGANRSYPVVVLPSSRSEFLGVADFDLPWGDFSSALERLIEELEIEPEDIVLKAHPVWTQHVAKKSGGHILAHYQDWARRNGIGWIEPNDRIGSNDLIRRADIVVVGGSTAGIDAALAGRKVILLGRAVYEGAGFVYQVKDNDGFDVLDRLERHDSVETCRRALRYLYTTTFRFPYFSDCVIPLDFFHYDFARPGPARPDWIPIADDGEPWIAEFAEGEGHENEPIRKCLNAEFEMQPEYGDLSDAYRDPMARKVSIRRRLLFRGIDRLRMWLPRGDKMGARRTTQERD